MRSSLLLLGLLGCVARSPSALTHRIVESDRSRQSQAIACVRSPEPEHPELLMCTDVMGFIREGVKQGVIELKCKHEQ